MTDKEHVIRVCDLDRCAGQKAYDERLEKENCQALEETNRARKEKERKQRMKDSVSTTVGLWKEKFTYAHIESKLQEARNAGESYTEIVVDINRNIYEDAEYIDLFDEQMKPIIERMIDTRDIGVFAYFHISGRYRPLVVMLYFRPLLLPDMSVYAPGSFFLRAFLVLSVGYAILQHGLY